MSPISSRAALRLLISALLATSVANAAALPNQVLDARSPDTLRAQLPSTEDIAAALDAVDDSGPGNVFEDIEQGFRSRSGLQVIKDFFARLFGWDTDSNTPATTTTITVTATPVAISSETPAGTTSDFVSEIIPTPLSSEVFSILPVGPLTTAINVPFPEPVFSSSEPIPEVSSIVLVIPPFPVNSTVLSGPTATAVVITDQFPAIDPTLLIPSTPTDLPSVNETADATSTSTLVITTTVPFLGTGVASVGTGVPIVETAIPLWSNSSYVAPTVVLSTGALEGTGIVDPLATAIATPLFPNTTVVIPVVVNATGGPVATFNVSLPVTIPPFANATYAPPPVLGTGTGAVLPVGTGSALPIVFTALPQYTFPNVSYAFPTLAPTAILGTGIAAPVAGTISAMPIIGTISAIPIPIVETAIPLFPNVTISAAPIPIVETAAPLFPNVTISAAPIPIVETAIPLFPNVTTTTLTTTTTILDLPTLAPVVNVTITTNDTTLDFPGQSL